MPNQFCEVFSLSTKQPCVCWGVNPYILYHANTRRWIRVTCTIVLNNCKINNESLLKVCGLVVVTCGNLSVGDFVKRLSWKPFNLLYRCILEKKLCFTCELLKFQIISNVAVLLVGDDLIPNFIFAGVCNVCAFVDCCGKLWSMRPISQLLPRACSHSSRSSKGVPLPQQPPSANTQFHHTCIMHQSLHQSE